MPSLRWGVVLSPIKLRHRPWGRPIGVPAELVSGIRYAAAQPALRCRLVAGTSVWLAYGAFNSLEPIFYREILNTGPAALGWMNALFGVGMVGGTVLALRLSPFWWRAPALPVLVALNGAAGLIYVSTDRLWVVAIGALCWGWVIGILTPVYRSLSVGHRITRGRVAGRQQMLSTLALGPSSSSPLGGQFGIQE